jgi:regulatory protein
VNPADSEPVAIGRSTSPDDPDRAAYVDALRRLARRDHSEQELRRALARKGHEEEVVEHVVARLRRERALDDHRYAETYSRSRLSHHGLGRQRIRQDLRRRGVARATVEVGLKEALADVPEDPIVDALARRYWAAHTRDEPRRRLQKLWGYLVRRGFPATLVHDRLQALWPRWQDALEGLEPADE